MTLNTTPYFVQTKEWADFWLSTMGKNHQAHYISYTFEGGEFGCWAYQYPWQLGQSFLYIPKGPVLLSFNADDSSRLSKEFCVFINKIVAHGESLGVVFVKIDFDYILTDSLGLKNDEQILNIVKQNVMCPSSLSAKTIQYLSTMILDCTELIKSDFDDGPDNFYRQNQSFFGQTNENIRRYTRKSLTKNWVIDTTKTSENFEHFWSVYLATAHRQNFAIHPRDYFEKMLGQDFVRLIVLKDESGVPHCCWLGVKIGDTLYYLYGGNDSYSFENYGQYLIHLVALQIASNENVTKYDLGGYDNSKGFGKFKEGYRGEIVRFLGPIDILLKPVIYHSINKSIQIVKSTRSLIARSK